MTTKSRIKCVGYGRISSIGQRSVDGSLRIQEQLIRDKANSEGWELVAYFEDDGKSGTSIAGRPAFKNALKHVETHLSAGDRIIIASDSRFGRNGPELVGLSAELFKKGIIVVTPNNEFSNDHYLNEYEWYDNLMKAAIESRRNSYETTRTMRMHAGSGRYQSKAPFGYENLKGVPGVSLAVIQEEAEVVAWVFNAYYEGAEITDLAKQIHSFPIFVSRKRRSSKKMTHTQTMNWIRETLKRDVYRGILKEKRTDYLEVEGDWSMIVPNNIFLRVQQRLLGKHGVGRNHRLEEFPLKGILFCEMCGLPWTASTSIGRKKPYTYYHCQGRKTQCKGARVAVKDIHADFEKLLGDLQMPDDLEQTIIARVEERAKDFQRMSNERRRQALHHIERAKDMERRAVESFLNGDIDKSSKDEVVSTSRAAITHHEKVLDEIVELDDTFIAASIASGRKLCSKPLETWKSLPKEQKWRFARGFFPNGITLTKVEVRNVDSLATATLSSTNQPESLVSHP
jgi:DNA invertase Pin-like site-specific DNA recombinase